MAAHQYYFTITDDRDGYRGRFYGAFGRELIWWTEAYVRRADAVTAVAIMQQKAATAPLL